MIPRLPASRPSPRPPAGAPSAAAIDLQAQLADLLGSVAQAEANWRFDDRLDVALKIRRKRAGR